MVQRHRFPDGELKLKLPSVVSEHVVILRSLDHPNEKLIELLLCGKTAQELGAKKLTLISPYLAYMRQDIAFTPGEAVSQRIIAQFLGSIFDHLITVDPHMHRISKLEDVAPDIHTIVLSGAPVLGDWIADQFKAQLSAPILIGPDGESEQWIAQAAMKYGFEYAACHKVRHGDFSVEIELPNISLQGRHVVILDDVASSGRTIAGAAKLILGAGASSVDVAVTHALFSGDAREVIQNAGVRNIWSTDCIKDTSNVVSIASEIANALKRL
jgi:ribose-phosphate pyrophosphokinase